MRVTVDAQPGGAAVLHLVGRLDLVSATAVKRHLAEAVAAGHRRLVADLAEVPFIDSTGLASDLRIARANDQARVILRLTKLDRVLRPYPTVEEALAGY
jgi:anti-sigma B factor antagonist